MTIEDLPDGFYWTAVNIDTARGRTVTIVKVWTDESQTRKVRAIGSDKLYDISNFKCFVPVGKPPLILPRPNKYQ